MEIRLVPYFYLKNIKTIAFQGFLVLEKRLYRGEGNEFKIL